MPDTPITNPSSTARIAALGALAVGAGLVAAHIATARNASSQQNALNLIQRTSRGGRNGSLVFPGDLLDNKNFFMSIGFVKYERRSIFDPPTLPPTSGNIYLPIPDNLVDNQTVSYQNAESPVIGAVIEEAIKGGRSGKSALENFQNLGTGFLSGIQSLVINQVRDAVSAIPGGVVRPTDVDQLLQLGGMAVNPFMTVLFKQPTFKTHIFSWKLNPANAEESATLANIVKAIRANMLPNLIPGQGGTLLGYPNMAILQLFPNEDFLYKFKPCVVESMQVNFAPGTTPGFFKGTNAPTNVVLSLQLKEIEYWLQEDVTGDFRLDGSFSIGGGTDVTNTPQSRMGNGQNWFPNQ